MLRQHLLLPAEMDVLEAALADGLPQIDPQALNTVLACVSAAPPAQRSAVLRAQLSEWRASSSEQDPHAAAGYVLDAWLEALCEWSGGYLLGQLVYRVCNRVLGEQGLQAVAGFTQAEALYDVLHGGSPAQWLRWWSRQPPVASPWREIGAASVPAALHTLLDPLHHLMLSPVASPVRLVLLVTVCALASQLRHDTERPVRGGALQRIAQLPQLLETLAAAGTLLPPALAPPSAPTLGITHVPAEEQLPRARRTPPLSAPWPPSSGTRSGALTAFTAVGEPRDLAPHASPSWFPLAQAAMVGPGFTLAGGGGLRPNEARITVLPVFTTDACAALLGMGALSYEEFNDAIQAWFAHAGVTARPTDEALEALFEAADDRIRERLQSAQVPLLTQRLLQRTRSDTRIYLFMHALRVVHGQLSPAQAPASAVREADTWLHAFDTFFRQQEPDPRILQTWPAPAPPPPAPAQPPTSSRPAAERQPHRSKGSVQRVRWIKQATPAQAARLFAVAADMQGDAAGEGLAQFVEAAMGPAKTLYGSTQPLAPPRLIDWLESPAGQAQLIARLRRVTDVVLRKADAPLPSKPALSLLVKAVRHHVPALDAVIANVTPAGSAEPAAIPSLAVTIRQHAPLLPARHCLLFAAVLRGGAATPRLLPATLTFPLSPPAVNVPSPLPELEPLLAGWGLPLFEELDPGMPGWQAWQLMAGTAAFSAFAREGLDADGWRGGAGDAASALGEQLQVAQLLLNQHVGPTRMQRIREAADAPGIVAARQAVMEQLPTTRSPLAQRVLLWLVARQLQRPELLVDDVPDWLDYGRSLLGVAFLQGVAMVEAANPGAAAGCRFEDLVRLPAQLGGSTDDDGRSLVAAHVRAALLYARAHDRLPASLDPATATATHIDAALSFLSTRQLALAVAAGQLQRRPPERMALAAMQLQAAQVPPEWWDRTLDDLTPSQLTRHGLHRRSARALSELPGEVGMVKDLAQWAALGEALLEEQLAGDTLQQLLVSGEFEIAGAASIAQLFEQEFALYQRGMTDALAVLAARSLEMLPPADRALLAGATVTPLQLPGHHQGTLLRCVQADDGAPIYLALVPSAGFSARLWHGERYDGTQWQKGHWYDPAWFETGQVATASAPDALRLLQPEQWIAGAPLAPQGAGADALQVIAEAAAQSQFGDYFNTVKARELEKRTGMERLWDKEHAVANALLEFCVPFYGCVSRLSAGDHSGGVLFSCAIDLAFAIGPVGRFLGSTTRLAFRAGELTVHGLLEGSGQAVAQLGRELAGLSGAVLARDLGRGVFRAGRGLWRLAADRIGAAGRPLTALTEAMHALPARAEPVARRWADDAPGLAVGAIDAEPPALLIDENGRWYRFDDVQRRAYGPSVKNPRIEGRVIDEIAPGFDPDAPLHERTDPPQLSSSCRRTQRQVSLHACSEGIVRLFGFDPVPTYDTPGDVGWFAGIEVSGVDGPLGEGMPFVHEGQWWQRVRTDGQLRYVQMTERPEPVLRQHLQAKVLGGDGRLARIEVRNPYHGTRMRLALGAVIGTDRQGGRVLIARIAPGRFHVAPLDPDFRFGEPAPALTLTPLEAEGFSAAHNDAVKGAWWGAFHYSQQCRLSGPALVDHFGSQLQRQVEALDEMDAALEQVNSDAPYRFDTRPEHAVLSCARSNCRYIDALKQQIGSEHWRAPRPTDRWVHEALYDLLHPPTTPPLPGRVAARSGFDALDASLESLHLTPRRGPAKTVAMARISLRGEHPPMIFHSVSGQRAGKGLLPASNLPSGQPAPEWTVAGRQITTPDAVYIDAQPTRLSVADGQVASTVPNHSLHVVDPDGMLAEERNSRAYDAERNLYYRIVRWLDQGRLAPEQVESISVFSSRPVCTSCHVSIGSLRARFPGIPFEVIERNPAALAVPPD